MQDLNKLLNDAIAFARPHLSEGRVASYIPELAKGDPSRLGVSVLTRGKRYRAGDTEDAFTMQSIAKVFLLILALETAGAEELFRRVGMAPSEAPFNCLPAVENHRCIPANPMLNGGCFVTLDCIRSDDTYAQFLSRVRRLCNNSGIQMDESVYRSEKSCSERNREILQVLSRNHALNRDTEEILDLHVKTSSVLVTADDLAFFGGVLSNGGRDPFTGEVLIEAEIVKTVKTIMFLCGMYNAAGRYAMDVGLPSKSGVGGGIVAVGRDCGIAVYGPALDSFGNSVGGQKILEYLSKQCRLHIFDCIEQS